MYSLESRIEHGISPSGRNDILELCNSLGRQAPSKGHVLFWRTFSVRKVGY
ncbi:MAG: hypothetical protein ACYC49_15550 [Ignavibacteriaceae bacterium]